MLGELWGYIDVSGSMIIEPAYPSAADFSDGLAAVSFGYDQEWGYIDKSGDIIIEPQFSEAKEFSQGLAAVSHIRSEDLLTYAIWGFIDRSGTEAIPIIYDFAEGFRNDLAKVLIDGKWCYMDSGGELIYKPIGDQSH